MLAWPYKSDASRANGLQASFWPTFIHRMAKARAEFSLHHQETPGHHRIAAGRGLSAGGCLRIAISTVLPPHITTVAHLGNHSCHCQPPLPLADVRSGEGGHVLLVVSHQQLHSRPARCCMRLPRSTTSRLQSPSARFLPHSAPSFPSIFCRVLFWRPGACMMIHAYQRDAYR